MIKAKFEVTIIWFIVFFLFSVFFFNCLLLPPNHALFMYWYLIKCQKES